MQYGKSSFRGVFFRVHCPRLCIETPRAGGRVLEEGDKKLLALAHELQSGSFWLASDETFTDPLPSVC